MSKLCSSPSRDKCEKRQVLLCKKKKKKKKKKRKKEYMPVRRKIKIIVFPLTCCLRDRVGRSVNLFIFPIFFSFLKTGKIVKNNKVHL